MKSFLKRFFAPDLLLAETQRDIAREDCDYWNQVAVDFALEIEYLKGRNEQERNRNRDREQELFNSLLTSGKWATIDLSSDLSRMTGEGAAVVAEKDFYDNLPGENLLREEKILLWQRAEEIAPQTFDLVTQDSILECYKKMLLNPAYYLSN